MYKCDCCAYTTNREFNLKKHFERKISCNTLPNPKTLVPNPKTQVHNPKTQGGEIEVIEDNKYICEKCSKHFTTKSNLNKHIKSCKGFVINSLQCEKCKKTFTSTFGKYLHKKNVNCVPIVTNDVQTLNLQIGDHNTMNINNQKIIINNFGHESICHLTKHNDICFVMNKYAKRKVYGLVQILTDILLDKEHPENHTIMKLTQRGDIMHVRDNEEDISDMRYREFEDTRNELLNLIRKCFEMYYVFICNHNIKLSKENQETKCMINFIKLYISLKGATLSFIQYFDINECEIHKDMDIEEILKNNKTFDKATKEIIHYRTSVLLKSIIKNKKSLI
jgi:hypothetical protein